MTLTTLLILAFAATRIARLLTFDEFGPLHDLRLWIHSRWPGEDTRWLQSEVTQHLDETWTTLSGHDVFADREDGLDVWLAVTPHPFGRLWECIRCMSVWSGLFVMVCWALLPLSVVYVMLLPFAVSQAAIILKRAE